MAAEVYHYIKDELVEKDVLKRLITTGDKTKVEGALVMVFTDGDKTKVVGAVENGFETRVPKESEVKVSF
jgi:hypothetical protein